MKQALRPGPHALSSVGSAKGLTIPQYGNEREREHLGFVICKRFAPVFIVVLSMLNYEDILYPGYNYGGNRTVYDCSLVGHIWELSFAYRKAMASFSRGEVE